MSNPLYGATCPTCTGTETRLDCYSLGSYDVRDETAPMVATWFCQVCDEYWEEQASETLEEEMERLERLAAHYLRAHRRVTEQYREVFERLAEE